MTFLDQVKAEFQKSKFQLELEKHVASIKDGILRCAQHNEENFITDCSWDCLMIEAIGKEFMDMGFIVLTKPSRLNGFETEITITGWV